MKFTTQTGFRLLTVAALALSIAACKTTPKPLPPGGCTCAGRRSPGATA